MTHWFGDSWGAPVCEMCPHIETPIGRACGGCRVPIVAGDQGFAFPYFDPEGHDATIPYHLRCFIDSILPSVLLDRGRAR